MVWRKRHISRLLHMPVQNAVSLSWSKNAICFMWSALEMSRFASWLYERGIFYVNCIQFFCLKRRLSKWLEERNIYQGFRAGNGLLCFRALRMRHISPILYFIFLCKAYFCLNNWKTRHLLSLSHLIWVVPLYAFKKAEAYLAIAHTCCICLPQAP